MAEKDGNAYLETLDRMEKDIAAIDASAGWASIAISLKRIADALEKIADLKTETKAKKETATDKEIREEYERRMDT